MIKLWYGALITILILHTSCAFAGTKPHAQKHSIASSSSGPDKGLPLVQLDKLEPGLIPVPSLPVIDHPKVPNDVNVRQAGDKGAHAARQGPPSIGNRVGANPAILAKTLPGVPKNVDKSKDEVNTSKADEANLDRWASAIKVGLTFALLIAVGMFISNHIQQRPRADIATTGMIVVGAVVVGALVTIVAYLAADQKHPARAGRNEHGPQQWVVLESASFQFDVCMLQPVTLERQQIHEFWKNIIRHEDDDRNFMEVTYEHDEESIKGQPENQAEARYLQQKYVFDPRLSATKAVQRWTDLFQGKITSVKDVEVPGIAPGRDVEGTVNDAWSFHVVAYTAGAGQLYVAVVSGSPAFVNSPEAKRFISSLRFKKG
jgi:hypothetical protein